MLRRRGLYAIRALLELAVDPLAWCSVSQIAAAQGIPAPMLEQLLLRLRRAQLVEARRGRSGGYRLGRAAAAIPLAAVLQAVDADPAPLLPGPEPSGPEADPGGLPAPGLAGERVAAALERRLRLALQRELAALTLEELLFDLRSWQECLREDGGLMLG
jgi:Rrf2 family protein